MKKICLMLCLIMLLSLFPTACKPQTADNDLKNDYVSINENVTAYWQDGSEFTPVLRFVAGSDLHFRQWYTSQTIPRLSYFIDDMYAYARTQEYDKIDAFIFNGDLTELGTDVEFESLNSVLQSKINQEESIVLMPYAGHDCIQYFDAENNVYTTDKSEVVARMESVTGNESGVHITIKGFHFITVSTMQVGMTRPEDEFVEGYDQTWIKNQLEDAENDDEYKPIFMFYHHPQVDTLLGTKHDDSPGGEDYFLPVLHGNSTYIDYEPTFKSTLKQFPQLIYFSGHYHSSLKNPLSIVQDDFTCIDTGSLTYCSMISNNFRIREDPINKAYANSATSAMNVVEVDADGRIRVLPYNIVNREFYNGIGDQSDRQIVRYIEDASNPETWLYKKQDRINKADVPKFMNTDITVMQTQNGVKIKFYQAEDKDGVDSYLIEVFKTGSSEHFKKYAVSSQYFANIVPEFLYLNFTVDEELLGYNAQYYDGKKYLFNDKLQSGEYTIKITPYDVYSKVGTPITTTFTI